MAAGGDNDVSFLLTEYALVFIFNDRCSDGGLLYVIEAELFKGAADRLYSNSVVIRNEGGSDTCNYGVACLEKNSYLLGAICDLLSILRALNDTVAAKYTLVTYDLRLATCEADRLYGALSYTAEA